MKNTLVGRENERAILLKALQSDESEMVAVLGRRRVGKTFLVRSVYSAHICFEITGLQKASLVRQLSNFSFQLKSSFGALAPVQAPGSWLVAFQQLIECLTKAKSPVETVLFFDELPWLASRKSGFLEGLGFFWNSWAAQKNIVVVICGSAASWMIQKVVHDKGGLHNRITKRIHLQPFNLYETEMFLQSRNVHLDRYQILQLYMAMGGIPHYLKEIEAGKSAAQNIEQICFTATGLLYDEFQKLYPALFEKAENHIAIITALAQKWKGLTRTEIIHDTKLSDGGGINRCLEELVSSGFIGEYYSFGNRKKEMFYRLTDEYSLFYLKFMQGRRNQGTDVWHHLSQTPSYKSWSGYAFESICLRHIPQIKKALGIAGIYAEISGFYRAGIADQSGVQIDLLIDRKDHVINLFELKFYNEVWQLSKSDAQELRHKISAFLHFTQTRKQVFLNVISTFGLQPNQHSLGLVTQSMNLDVLFEKG